DASVVDIKNMFSVGPILDSFGKMCLDLKCLPVIAHHFVKSREIPGAPPDLSELAYGSVSQWMRQWWLVSRREPYDKATGVHKLHWLHGGSFGHSGELALDINTGILDDDFRGRKWDVTVHSTPERIEAEQQGKEAALQERKAAKDAEKDAEERLDMG